ncbi:MAG: glycosyltransferase family 4 protein [Planctomycetota bacterium]|nr:glycosyltransferase family 4 protein [Planctomycetota bacterium]
MPQVANTLLILVSELSVTSPGGQILDHAKGLIERGVPVTIVTGGGRLVKEAQNFGVSVLVRQLPRVKMLDYMLVRRLARELRSLGTRLVHAYGTEVAQLASHIAQKANCPWILEVHNQNQALSAGAFEMESLFQILVPSEELRAHLVHKHKVPKELLKVLRPGIDCDRASIRPRPRTDQMPVIASCGPFLPTGNHETLVQAAKRLKDKGREFQLLLIGDGPERAALWDLCSDLEIVDQVVFTLDQPSRSAVFELVDIYVDCSPREAISHDLFEAMARGIVAVACRAGSVHDLITDRQSGRVVISGEDGELSEILLETLEIRPEERELMGQAARRRVQSEFPVKSHLIACINLYNSALDRLEDRETPPSMKRTTSRRWRLELGLDAGKSKL